MRKVTLSIPVAVLALCLAAAQLPAQQPGSGNFQWYFGGQGGILNFETIEGRHTIPSGGGHMLITARRTGLLLSVDEGLGSNEVGIYTLQNISSTGAITSQEAVAAGFKDLRRYSATLLAFPIRGPATPYFGIGVGFMHVSGVTPDDDFTKAVGSAGFGSFIGGLNFRVSRFSAFGQYQITTSPSVQNIVVRFTDGTKMAAFGNLFSGPTHTFTAGIRFGLGNARERATSGGY
jgi:opacity protein-like surface antigen